MFDRYENRPRHEDGFLEGFVAQYHYVHEGNGTRALLHQEPLRELPLQFFGRELTFFEPSAWEPGLVGASATLNRTGTYEVTVLHRAGIVNGTPFNITIVAGPPDVGQTSMQVCMLTRCLSFQPAEQGCTGSTGDTALSGRARVRMEAMAPVDAFLCTAASVHCARMSCCALLARHSTSVRFVGWADWVDCRCFLSFVFLGVARRLELSPCNTPRGHRRRISDTIKHTGPNNQVVGEAGFRRGLVAVNG